MPPFQYNDIHIFRFDTDGIHEAGPMFRQIQPAGFVSGVVDVSRPSTYTDRHVAAADDNACIVDGPITAIP
jgi:hypothetical protein